MPERNRFSLAAWKDAAREATADGDSTPIDADELLENLVRVRLIVPAGYEKADRSEPISPRAIAAAQRT